MTFRYLNLPPIPKHIVDDLNHDYDRFEPIPGTTSRSYYRYIRSMSFTEELRDWCNENVCQLELWGVQLIKYNIPIHKDFNGIKQRLTYVIETGGDNVETIFYDDNKEITQVSVIEPFRWHLLDAGVYHSVKGVSPGNIRFAVSAPILHDIETTKKLRKEYPDINNY
jgi:hypothetical protein